MDGEEDRKQRVGKLRGEERKARREEEKRQRRISRVKDNLSCGKNNFLSYSTGSRGQ